MAETINGPTKKQLRDALAVLAGLVTVWSQASIDLKTAIANQIALPITYGELGDPIWIAQKATDTQQLRLETRKIIDNLKDKLSDPAIGIAIATLYLNGQATAQDVFIQALGGVKDVKDIIDIGSVNISDALINGLNKTLSSLNNSTIQAYRNTFNDWTPETTIPEAVDELKLAALIDAGGKAWSSDTYATMAVRTSIAEAGRQGAIDYTVSQDMGNLATIEGSAGCDLCAPWEGEIVSLSGENNDYPSIEEAYGDGCFHPNCKHDIVPIVPDYQIQAEITDGALTDE
jgi:hypothetical protein